MEVYICKRQSVEHMVASYITNPLWWPTLVLLWRWEIDSGTKDDIKSLWTAARHIVALLYSNLYIQGLVLGTQARAFENTLGWARLGLVTASASVFRTAALVLRLFLDCSLALVRTLWSGSSHSCCGRPSCSFCCCCSGGFPVAAGAATTALILVAAVPVCSFRLCSSFTFIRAAARGEAAIVIPPCEVTTFECPVGVSFAPACVIFANLWAGSTAKVVIRTYSGTSIFCVTFI